MSGVHGMRVMSNENESMVILVMTYFGVWGGARVKHPKSKSETVRCSGARVWHFGEALKKRRERSFYIRHAALHIRNMHRYEKCEHRCMV